MSRAAPIIGICNNDLDCLSVPPPPPPGAHGCWLRQEEEEGEFGERERERVK